MLVLLLFISYRANVSVHFEPFMGVRDDNLSL